MMNNSSLYPLHTDANAEKEIGLADVAQFLKGGKRWIATTALVCTILGVAYALIAPAKFEASASIEMASVAGNVVEAPSTLAEKLKMPLYYSAATYKACGAENKRPTPGQFLASQLKPAVNKNAPIVNIRFRAKSSNEAHKCLEAVLMDIRKNQAILSKPILDAKNAQLRFLMQNLESAEKLLGQLPVGHVKFDFNDPKFSASALLLATAVAKENEIKELRDQISQMQVSLTQPQTRDTTLVTPIYAPETRVEPDRLAVILGSLLGGFVLGILIWGGRKMIRCDLSASSR